MTKNNTLSKDLQEIVDKVFPPYTGDMQDALKDVVLAVSQDKTDEAIKFCASFNPSTASEDDWMKLDWALAMPGVAEHFPDWERALKQHFKLEITIGDFEEVVANIILATSAVVRDVVNSEDTIDCFRSTFEHYLPKPVARKVEMLLTQEAINQCDRELLPVDNSLR